MAQQDILLPGIEHDRQSAFFLCGPACINMVLSYWDKQQPQDVLWTAVQGNSGTVSRPIGAPQDEGTFATQVCDLCTDATFHCWYTTPEAMAATINETSPTTVKAEYETSQKVFERIADSLSAASPIPAVFTTLPSLHWVVAVGYQLDGTGPAVVWNGQKITGLYVRDPNEADPWPDTTVLVTTTGLLQPLSGLLMAVECGVNNVGKYPVVSKGVPDTGGGGGGGQGGGSGPQGTVEAVSRMWSSFLVFAYRPWRYFMPGRDPRRPGPQPPPNQPGGGP